MATITINRGNTVPRGGLLAEYEVTGAAETQIDITGLDSDLDGSYRTETEIYNPTASGVDSALCVNNDLTESNYYRAMVFGLSSGVSIAADASPRCIPFAQGCGTRR